MKVSAKAINVIKHHEGTRQRAYRCPAKLWTIGVGHVLYPEQGKLKIEQRDAYPLRPEDDRVFSMEEVDAILRADLDRFERGVTQFCPITLTQGEFDGLVSFSFNCGLGTLQRSTLRRKLLRGDKEGAADEFLKYCMAGGKPFKGLQNRRIDERSMFLSLTIS
ncbi:COG3772 Phage-related lysozyme (muraminidase) [uncultured Caudovirales phage]|uniref:Endolysin n=1 Tax=uncultured Caudovirales phage TaxID=2100421 RepID=A0A6J5LXZ6_9CAUD|nr:COG3772 Phage-related lysozyme (muraminidase) [uncultured Caudovirales phage]